MDVVTLRFVERILAVLIGGVAVYLGYRLFLKIPEQRDSDGRITLPWHVSVVLSRVGPGIFFALFGAVVVGLSLYKAIAYEETAHTGTALTAGVDPGALSSGATELKQTAEQSTTFSGVGSARVGPPNHALHDARARLRKEIALLNTLPAQLKTDLQYQDRSHAERGIRDVKLLLMKGIWDDGEWGEFTRFEDWIRRGAQGSPPAGLEKPAEYFRYPR